MFDKTSKKRKPLDLKKEEGAAKFNERYVNEKFVSSEGGKQEKVPSAPRPKLATIIESDDEYKQTQVEDENQPPTQKM